MSVNGKVIVITGAASGIGLETARLFASKGARLSLADVQEKPLKDIETELQQSGAEVMVTVIDVRSHKSVDDWIKATVARFGKLDGAANLAGVLGHQGEISVVDIDDTNWDFIFDINTKGIMRCLRAEVPSLNEGGAIVNASSVLGLLSAPYSMAYTASKHAVVGITKCAAKELGNKNIRVNCICPGPINTFMLSSTEESRGAKFDPTFLPLKRVGEPKEVALLIEFLLSSASSYITGVAMPIDGGWSA